MQATENDFEMHDVPMPTIPYQPFTTREPSNGSAKPANGYLAHIRPSIESSTNASNRGSRETSVLAKVTTQLSLESPSATESEDDLATLGEHREEPLPYYSGKTGLCYDARMRFHTELSPPKDRSDYHPEDPRRILHIYRELCEAGLVADPEMAIPPLCSNPVARIQARPAKKAEVCLVHDEAHFEFVKSTSGQMIDTIS